MIRCANCGETYPSYDVLESEEVDACVGCGMSPCYHCTATVYYCTWCGCEDFEENYEEEEEREEE